MARTMNFPSGVPRRLGKTGLRNDESEATRTDENTGGNIRVYATLGVAKGRDGLAIN